MRAQFEVLIFRVTSIRYCLISQNGQVVENWNSFKRSASRTEIRTTDLAAMEITVDQQDDNHEVQKPTDWPVQVDESTDVSDPSILLIIARYFNVNELEENLFLCYPLTIRCTGGDIFNAIQGYFCENEIDLSKCCGVRTDGGKSMSGFNKGLSGHIKIVAPHVAWSHCCITDKV
ncbi:hypothetical protein AVEN_98895-1 [Araneus ventricosus]|uniref:Zinc finger BED domain-containing protein 5 n=1 Tax=Araneus ventricosus TaxID=182803 RepID=A0A4Y2FV67_ARAVE|nr:hypothetical protein AVEN_98895-1 [Araneus ventricosus]